MKKYFVVVMIPLLFITCSKNNESSNSNITASLSGSYKVTSVKYKASSSSVETDYYNNYFVNICNRDNAITFNTGGIYVRTDMDIICTPLDDFTGSWAISGSVLLLDGVTCKIEGSTSTTVTYSISNYIIVGDKLIIELTKYTGTICRLTQASVAGNYRISAVRYKATSSSPEADYYNQWFTDPCERDDVVALNANGSYVFTDAGVKCVPPGDDTGTWSISGNSVIIDGFSSNVESFSCTSITVSNTNVLVVGDKVILVLTRQ